MLNINKKEELVEKKDIDRIIDNIRGLSIDMINEAKSGHPGIALGAAPILATLYNNHIKIDQKNPNWISRDRFIMSAGHGSSLLYATLFMAGFDIPFEELKKFRKLGSITPGHPEYGVTPGVDISTGPLGSGLASSVGICLAERFLRDYFGENIVNYYTYVLCGDGDLMEGMSYEALSLAGKLCLNKLIVLYDSNGVTLDGSLESSFNEDIKMRFESINWNYLRVDDAENTLLLDDAINIAKNSLKPTIIEVKTVIGKYSINEGTCTVHGSPLSSDDISSIKEKLLLRDVPFTISQDVKTLMEEFITNRNKEEIERWNFEVEQLILEKKNDFDLLVNSNNPIKLMDIDYMYPEDMKDSTRNVSGKILNSIAKNYPFLIGGSADVSKSSMARIIDTLDNSLENPGGRNINFGIRESAMSLIGNGLALCGLTPFVSTFFSFSDYMKPGLRMSAMMSLPIIYVFSHDSISVGEDGPTHQPVEQLAGLRALPNFDLYRPADANETIGVYKAILENRKPSAIVLGRNKVRIQDVTSSSEVKNGAYIVAHERDNLEGIIISSGEELELTMDVYQKLIEKGYGIRVVSMPSMSLFERQDKDYIESIIPKNVKTFVIEASSSLSWYKYVKDDDNLFTIDTFGLSGAKDEVLHHFGFDSNIIQEKIERKLNE
ncbi:MAG: transketolase [Bacilli bacterium]|nr:transketolase [Bacilli bacterium]